jgi:hypothetical protein
MRDRITLAVEGRTDEAVGKRLLAHAGIEAGAVYGLRGKHDLDGKLPAYNNAARFSPWLVLRDLNTDSPVLPRSGCSSGRHRLRACASTSSCGR